MSGVVGAVLAGGRGERMGGAGKATIELAGRPLVEHAIAALRAAGLDEVVVVAKADTPLPERITAPFWPDEDDDHHPRHGIVSALRYAEPLPVLVLAVDLPLVPRETLVALRDAPSTTVARTGQRLQPLCARYAPATLATFEAAPADEPLTRTVERLAPHVLDLRPGALLNLNTSADLAAAEQALAARSS